MIQREERVGLGLASTSRNSTRWHKASAPTAAMRSSINCSRLNPASSPAMASSRTTCAVDGLCILPPLAGQYVSGGAGRILFTFDRFFLVQRFAFSVGRKKTPQLSKCFGDRAYHLGMSKQDSIPADCMEADALLRGVPEAEEEEEEEEGEDEEQGGENDEGEGYSE
jgi:hypothetical protein